MSIHFPFLGSATLQVDAGTKIGLEAGQFRDILTNDTAKSLIFRPGSEPHQTDVVSKWIAQIKDRIESASEDSKEKGELFLIGIAAFELFLQANVTGPTLDLNPAETFFPDAGDEYGQIHRDLILHLTVDGEAVYSLTPHVELFVLARILLNHDSTTSASAAWARLRVNFWHQKMLSDAAPSLSALISKDLDFLGGSILGSDSTWEADAKALFLLERAAVHMLEGSDTKAKDDIEEAARMRHFQYILTGRLGRRTKFQQNDLSQLVVLARSEESISLERTKDQEVADRAPVTEKSARPKHFDLNDDTVLERIAFAAKDENEALPIEANLPAGLAELDPSAQPMLNPIDATILLSLASSTTNTSPDDGLTREETLPYATRVLEGGSSNWQVYTQALLVRSRIEGHKSRTVERGALQLQALVDQVIAETSLEHHEGDPDTTGTATFLPRAKSSESASASERLRYIHQLDTPPRWGLEAELAARWASLGGLRTALEIYERLEMWAEVSLCLAATDDEKKAIRTARRQLFEPTGKAKDADQPFDGPERSSLPADAARLFCILGDLEKEPAHWERAWEVSHQRYARAQRSLGKYYTRNKNLPAAEEAYSKSLAANYQNASTWFAVGCVRLELRRWPGAVAAFQRCVHLEPEDAEAWSNLAAALLRLPAEESARLDPTQLLDDEDESTMLASSDPQKHSREAFLALKRAAGLKRGSYQIWQNLLNVGATLIPPPFTDILVAQKRILELRSAVEGEGCVDAEVLEGILQHLISSGAKASEASNGVDGITVSVASRPKHGLAKMYTELMYQRVIPLITHSRRLWQLAARLALFEDKPGSALDAYEKAWRTTLNQPGWDDASGAAVSTTRKGTDEEVSGPENAWRAVVEATDELVSAYESLGEREVTEGLKAGSGELVCKNWRFKARSAIRSVIGRRTKAGFDDKEVEGFRSRMEELKA